MYTTVFNIFNFIQVTITIRSEKKVWLNQLNYDVVYKRNTCFVSITNPISVCVYVCIPAHRSLGLYHQVTRLLSYLLAIYWGWGPLGVLFVGRAALSSNRRPRRPFEPLQISSPESLFPPALQATLFAATHRDLFCYSDKSCIVLIANAII